VVLLLTQLVVHHHKEQLVFGEKADYFSILVTVTFAKKENSMYQACKSENCNKKVVN
jgi:replication factor A1